MAFSLPNLPYAYTALEPHIDARTMEIHHSKHHAAYVNNLNAAAQGNELESMSIEAIMASISKFPAPVRNNGGGHWNHSFFWESMTENGYALTPQMNIAKAIDRDFGSFDEFKKQFSAAAATRFGSGWAWLCVDGDDKLFICSSPNQDNPLMDIADKKGQPVLGLDVWEHAYYLHFQNRRPDYVTAFFNVINWDVVTKRYNDANPGASKF
jgi:Fe-Mn family superoxide dismutase